MYKHAKQFIQNMANKMVCYIFNAQKTQNISSPERNLFEEGLRDILIWQF